MAGWQCMPAAISLTHGSHIRLTVHACWQVVFLELCSERRGILTMTKQEVGNHCRHLC